MLLRPHGLVPGKRIGILTAVLLLVAVIFFLANPLIARNNGPFSPGRDGARITPEAPVVSGAPEPEPEPEPLPELPEAPRRIPSGPPRGVAFMYADDEGVVLSRERPSLESPDGRSSLMLQRDGNLVLRSRGADGASNILWSTGTGDGRPATLREVRIASAPDAHPVLRVSATINGKQSTLWHSDLLPACASQPKFNSTTASRRRLELTSTGRLSLSDACDIYAPPYEHEAARSLALVISGTYATNQSLCAQSLLAQGPFISVDVFAHVSYEGADDVKGKIEDELKACYGEELRAEVVSPASKAEEKYPGGDEDEQLGVCHGEIHGANTRLKSLYNVGRAWWEWSAQNGVQHDTVLALRADLESEAEVPRFRALDELRDTLVMMRSKDDGYTYCPRMTGGVGIGMPSPNAISHLPPLFISYLLDCC